MGWGYSYGQMGAPPYCARRICWVGVTVMVRWQHHHTVLGGYVGLGLQLWSDGAPPYCARRICWVGVTVMVRWGTTILC